MRRRDNTARPVCNRFLAHKPISTSTATNCCLRKRSIFGACVPHILNVASSALGAKWIKRIVVEGYTDQVGSYLVNLNLSLQRSQGVLCTLLGKSLPDETEFTPEQRKQIQTLFLVGGGYSFQFCKSKTLMKVVGSKCGWSFGDLQTNLILLLAMFLVLKQKQNCPL